MRGCGRKRFAVDSTALRAVLVSMCAYEFPRRMDDFCFEDTFASVSRPNSQIPLLFDR